MCAALVGSLHIVCVPWWSTVPMRVRVEPCLCMISTRNSGSCLCPCLRVCACSLYVANSHNPLDSKVPFRFPYGDVYRHPCAYTRARIGYLCRLRSATARTARVTRVTRQIVIVHAPRWESRSDHRASQIPVKRLWDSISFFNFLQWTNESGMLPSS